MMRRFAFAVATLLALCIGAWAQSFPGYPTAGYLYIGQGTSPPSFSPCGGDCTSVSANGTFTMGKVNGNAWPSSGTSGGIPYWSAANTIASSAALTHFGVVYGGGAGSAPVATAAGANDQVFMGSTGLAPGWVSIANCSNALTYLTASHTFGCNTTAGTGTVTSAGIKASGGGTTSGTCTITSSGTCTIAEPGGFLNKIRNASFDVWQRGTTVSIGTTGNYGPDGWKIGFTGSTSVSAAQTASGVNGYPKFALSIVGATSNTDVSASQRIESVIAAPLAGQTVTLQFQYTQNTGSAVTPKISTCYASTTDNFTTCTSDLAATSLTSCASAAWCSEAYTFTASANAVNGYQVTIDCNAGFTSAQACLLTAVDVRVTPGVTTGINASPPPAELRPISIELASAQRYYEQITVPLIQSPAASSMGVYISFAATKRANPTMGTVTACTAGSISAQQFFGTTPPTGFSYQITASAASGNVQGCVFSASAEL